MTNYGEHCAEEIVFPVLGFERYAGQCGVQGSSYHGSRESVKIQYPLGIAYDGNQTIYISLYQAHKIITVDIVSEEGSELCSTAHAPRYMSIDAFTGNVLVSMNGGLGVLRMDGSVKASLAAEYGRGSSIGTLNSLRIQTADDLIQLDNGTWMLMDFGLHR